MRQRLTMGIIASALTITVATVFDDLARALNDFGMIVVVAVAYGGLYMTALTFGYLLRGGASVSGGRQRVLMLMAASLIPIRPKANRKRIHLQIKVKRKLPELEADPSLVLRILVIFLSNAVKFTPEGGEVLILARKDPNAGVRLRISNTGIGMTEEEISTAFDSFVQSDSSLARKYEGSGMGLPMARSMARLQGADVALASEPGVGTMATLQILIARGVETVPSPPRTPRWYRIRWANRLNPPPIQTSLTVKAC